MAKKHSPGFIKIVEQVKVHITECNIHDVKQKLDAGEAFHLVDVREESEFAAGRLPGAMHLSKGVIERDVEETLPHREATIVLYCGGGYRSALAAYNLQQMGYTNVISMDGGWRCWCEAEYPVEGTR